MPNIFLAGARVEITVADLASLMLDIGKHVHVCPEPRLKQELILHDLLPWDVGFGGGVPLQHPHEGDDFVTTDDSVEERWGATIFLDTLVPAASTEVGIDTFTVCDPWQGAFLSEVRPKPEPKFDAWNSYKQCSGHTTAAKSSPSSSSLSMAKPEFDTKSEHVASQGILEEDLLITSPTDDELKEELQKKAVEGGVQDELNKALVALGIGSVGLTYWETLTNSVDEVDFVSSFLEVLAQADECAEPVACRMHDELKDVALATDPSTCAEQNNHEETDSLHADFRNFGNLETAVSSPALATRCTLDEFKKELPEEPPSDDLLMAWEGSALLRVGSDDLSADDIVEYAERFGEVAGFDFSPWTWSD